MDTKPTKIVTIKLSFVCSCKATFLDCLFKKVISRALVEYEMIIANSALRASLAIFHLAFKSSITHSKLKNREFQNRVKKT